MADEIETRQLRTSQWVMSHENESCHVTMSRTILKMSHGSCEWYAAVTHITMSHVTKHKSRDSRTNHVTLIRVVSRTNESCLVRMRHVTYARDVSHARKNHVTSIRVVSRTNESCHVGMRHVTYARDVSRKKESGHVKSRSLQKTPITRWLMGTVALYRVCSTGLR